jgi:phage terminase large subunit
LWILVDLKKKRMQKVNHKYSELFTAGPNIRYVILMGGRSAGRSHVASQYALARLRDPSYFRCAIMRLVAGDIENSIYQDILDRVEEQDLLYDISTRTRPPQFTYGSNIINGIGFRKSSGDQKSKLKSLASYNTIIIEEADEVGEDDFMQLDDSIRTIKGDLKVILLLNPPSKNHWIVKRWFNLVQSKQEGFYTPKLKESMKGDTLFIHTTHQDNIANISKSTLDNFARYRKTKPDHYWNMIRGLVSEGMRGRIFKNWQPMKSEEFDKIPYPSTYGLDFGFSNDPTALVEVKRHNQTIWLRELIYEVGLTTRPMSKRFSQVGLRQDRAIIYADGSEPRLIQELRDLGWNVIAADKGPGSVNAGIDMLLDYEVIYTEDSTNIALESQEYKWALDKEKNPTNDPVDKFNHAMDGTRYNVWTSSKQGFVGIV